MTLMICENQQLGIHRQNALYVLVRRLVEQHLWMLLLQAEELLEDNAVAAVVMNIIWQ